MYCSVIFRSHLASVLRIVFFLGVRGGGGWFSGLLVQLTGLGFLWRFGRGFC